MAHNLFDTLREFKPAAGATGQFYSLPALEQAGIGKISRLPVSIRIVLESVLRNCDGKKVTEEHVRAARQLEAPTRRAHRRDSVRRRARRAAGLHRRAAARRSRGDAQRRRARWARIPKMIEPLVPVDLVVDHSVQVDYYGTHDALDLNMKLEFKRNRERYQFMKWGMQAFDTFRVVPPGIGIVHQVNLEYLARGVHKKDGVYYPDTLVGTDSHTTMINGIGVVGWGVGGIEAEAGMLGQPVYFLTPDVVGVESEGRAARRRHRDRSRADGHRDAAQGEGRRQVRRVLRRGHRDAAGARSRDDRQHGAGVRRDDGLLPGRRQRPSTTCAPPAAPPSEIDAFEAYFKAQGLFGMPKAGEIDYTKTVDARPVDDHAVARRAEAPAGPHRARQGQARSPSCSASRCRTASQARQAAPRHTRCVSHAATASQRNPHRAAARLVEMVTTADARSRARIASRSTSATATC